MGKILSNMSRGSNRLQKVVNSGPSPKDGLPRDILACQAPLVFDKPPWGDCPARSGDHAATRQVLRVEPEPISCHALPASWLSLIPGRTASVQATTHRGPPVPENRKKNPHTLRQEVGKHFSAGDRVRVGPSGRTSQLRRPYQECRNETQYLGCYRAERYYLLRAEFPPRRRSCK
jgi:hypothetical protein